MPADLLKSTAVDAISNRMNAAAAAASLQSKLGTFVDTRVVRTAIRVAKGGLSRITEWQLMESAFVYYRQAGYQAELLRENQAVIGYVVLMAGAAEAWAAGALLPLLFFDATFLPSMTLLTASAMTGDHTIIVMATMMARGETKPAYKKLMEVLRSAQIIPPVILSDAHAGLRSAAQETWPGVILAACLWHLLLHVSGRPRALAYAAFTARTQEDFQRVTGMLARLVPKTYAKLQPALDVCSPFGANPAPTMNIRASSAAEVIHAVLKHFLNGDDGPLRVLIEIASWNRKQAIRQLQVLKGDYLSRVEEALTESKRCEGTMNCRVSAVSAGITAVCYTVTEMYNGEIETYKCNIRVRACTCRRSLLTQMDCKHLQLCRRSAGEDPLADAPRYGRCQVVRAGLSVMATTVPPDALYDRDLSIVAPAPGARPGRPRKRRFRSRGEGKKQAAHDGMNECGF
jgi:hypothetical protein